MGSPCRTGNRSRILLFCSAAQVCAFDPGEPGKCLGHYDHSTNHRPFISSSDAPGSCRRMRWDNPATSNRLVMQMVQRNSGRGNPNRIGRQCVQAPAVRSDSARERERSPLFTFACASPPSVALRPRVAACSSMCGASMACPSAAARHAPARLAAAHRPRCSSQVAPFAAGVPGCWQA